MQASDEFLKDVLDEFITAQCTSVGRLAALSKVPKKTIAHWLSGVSMRPHRWQPMVQVALALNLDEAQTDRLLRAASKSPIRTLRQKIELPADRELLSRFNVTVALPPPFLVIDNLPTFVGRAEEVATLKQALLSEGRVKLYDVLGMGGVGKTSLAVHVAYLLRDEFPGGVLWARADAGDAMTILDVWARALGSDVSPFRDVESRAMAVRNLLANKRVLIILDNVESSKQIKPLLPPSTGMCAVLVTTRNDLNATDGWTHLPLKPFTANSGESLALFEKYLKKIWVQRHRAALMEIANLLGHLPLAMAIAAGQLRAQNTTGSIDGAVNEMRTALRNSATRLSRMQRDEQNVRDSFDLSYVTLAPEVQLFFAQLGLFGGEDFDANAIAFVAELPIEQAQSQLHQLMQRSLVQPSREGRFRLHPLLKDYALERLATQHQRLEQPSYLRACQFFTCFAQAHEREYAALDIEIENITHALHIMQSQQFDELFFAAAHSLQNYLETRGLYDYAKALYANVIALAETQHNDIALGHALRDLAGIVVRCSDYEQAIALSERGLAVSDSTGDQMTQAQCLNVLSAASYGQGDFVGVEKHNCRGLHVARTINDLRSISAMLINLGTIRAIFGDLKNGEVKLLEGKQLALEIGNLGSAAVASLSLGKLTRDQGRFEQALTHFSEGLLLTRQAGHREHQINLLNGLGDLKSRLGFFEEAGALLREALTMAEEQTWPWLQSWSCVTYAAHLLRRSQFEEAETYLSRGIALAESINATEIIADGIFIQAKLRLALYQFKEAKAAGQSAFNLFRQQKHRAKARQVQDWLEQLHET